MNTNASNTSVKVSKCSQSEHTGVTSTPVKKRPPWSLPPLTNPPDTKIGLTLKILYSFPVLKLYVGEVRIYILLCLAITFVKSFHVFA